ncbi:uncharacterized protein LOC126716188 [Quercus robur]|uniref:uncharacterized protein LOC126716188 n=1 Tax=Quercus robur TaxID=38942 RepID=UPI002162C175|nr:uncharacterized protein LOC126716188 [Quercus robur]
MEESGLRQTGHVDSQRQDNFLNFEWDRDQDKRREGSVNTSHTSRNRSKGKGHTSQKRDDHRALQQEIDDLKKRLRRAQRRCPSPSSDISDEEENEYRRRSRTQPSETFSYEKEQPYKRGHKSLSYKGLANNAMSKALDCISQSPFTRRIEGAELPRWFHQPTFVIYNGRMDPVEHVSQFNQRMAVYFRDEALMCKVFPSSLGPMAMRWFDGLKPNSISSFKQLTKVFGSRFITSSRVPRPLDSLLSLSMREGETLKAYSDIYWEMYNVIEGNYDDVAISTFKRGLPTKHGLIKSLTGKPVTSVRQLMDIIDKYKRVEEDQQTGKGKVKVVPQERRDFRSDHFNNSNRPRRDYSEQFGTTGAQAVHAVFREPLHKILEKVKNGPFFQWPSWMVGEPAKRNQNLYCEYHQESGHTTNDCKNLKNHLGRLVREGKLRHLLHHPIGRQEQSNVETRQSTLRPPIDMINVILAIPGRTDSHPFRVMSVA